MIGMSVSRYPIDVGADRRWRENRKQAKEIVNIILLELGARKGIGDELYSLDKEIWDELRETLIEKVKECL